MAEHTFDESAIGVTYSDVFCELRIELEGGCSVDLNILEAQRFARFLKHHVLGERK